MSLEQVVDLVASYVKVGAADQSRTPCLSAWTVAASTSPTHALMQRQMMALAPPCMQPVVHYGFIPAVIIVGMLFTKPRPTIGQLFFLG